MTYASAAARPLVLSAKISSEIEDHHKIGPATSGEEICVEGCKATGEIHTYQSMPQGFKSSCHSRLASRSASFIAHSITFAACSLTQPLSEPKCLDLNGWACCKDTPAGAELEVPRATTEFKLKRITQNKMHKNNKLNRKLTDPWPVMSRRIRRPSVTSAATSASSAQQLFATSHFLELSSSSGLDVTASHHEPSVMLAVFLSSQRV